VGVVKLTKIRDPFILVSLKGLRSKERFDKRIEGVKEQREV
jgi:hypothetical protein